MAAKKRSAAQIAQSNAEDVLIRLCPPLGIPYVGKKGKVKTKARRHGPTVQELALFERKFAGLSFDVAQSFTRIGCVVRCATKNPSNGAHGSHWAVTVPRKRAKAIGFVAGLACRKFQPETLQAKAIRVHLVRLVKGGLLDAHDNLRSALKGFVDGLALAFGKDDADPFFEFTYGQFDGWTGAPSVKVTVTVLA